MPRFYGALAVLLSLLFMPVSCGFRASGDPVLQAWEEACAGNDTPDAAGLLQFHNAVDDYVHTPAFVLTAQNMPEMLGIMEQLLALSADGQSEYTERAAFDIEVQLLRYGNLSSQSMEQSSYAVALIVVLLCVFSGLFLSAMALFLIQQRRFARAHRKAEMEQAVSAATIKMQEEERNRIYKELHDTVSQDSRSALFALQSLHRHISADPEAQLLYERITQLESANIENVRSVIRNIIPPDLLGDFRTMLLEWASNVSRGGFPCLISIKEDAKLSLLTQEQRLHLFRILQEAVANASRYSGAEEVSVLVRGGMFPDGRPSVVLIVSDDGKGFDPAALKREGHYGIRGMRNRAEILGGRFRIRSAQGDGCEVFIEIALKQGRLSKN